MRNIVVFDMDGTLSDCSWRMDLVPEPGGDWHPFQSAAKDDPPLLQVIAISGALQIAGMDIFICTGRSERYRELTEDWLARYCVPYRELLMRPDGDDRKTWIVKKDMIMCEAWCGIDPRRVVAVFDDDRRVIDMWREFHIAGLQCVAMDRPGPVAADGA